MTKRLQCVFIIPTVFFLDRILKFLVIQRYPEGGGFPVWPGVFYITRVNNTGAAFGIFRGSGSFLIWVSVVCLLFLGLYFFRAVLKKNVSGASMDFSTQEFAAWALVIGGALGNLVDRLYYGYVIDFLDFRVWPVFNLADASICAGVFLVVLRLVNFRWRAR